MVLVGYLPVDNLDDSPSAKEKDRMRGELLHRAMEALMEPIKAASREGIEMRCADGRLRRIYPMFAAFLADSPEQNDMACTIRSGCPICEQEWEGRGDYSSTAPMRTREETLTAIRRYIDHGKSAMMERLGLKPWWPWWAEFPIDFHSCIVPNVLHQLHKGLFKTHLYKWAVEILKKPHLDRCFSSMPSAPGMRQFKSGVTHLKQWTERESRELEKQFLPMMAGYVADDVVNLARAILDFTYRAQAARMSDEDIAAMEEALQEIHAAKDVLIKIGVFKGPERFDNIIKLHMVSHYAHSIRELGTPDGYSTEAPEALHSENVKEGWRASNKVDALPQMIRHVQRLEALRIHATYMREFWGPSFHGISSDDDESEWVDDDEFSYEETGDSPGVEAGDNGGLEASVACPDPMRDITKHPIRRRVPGTEIVSDYKATNLISSTTRCLTKRFNAPRPFLLSKHHHFDVWHRFYLTQRPLPFAPDETRQRDVVRAYPAVHKKRSGWLVRAAHSDTVLFTDQDRDVDKSGLHRKLLIITYPPLYAKISTGYRAGRVRAIFSLPSHLQSIYSGQLVYLELFNPFSKATPGPTRFYTTSHARHPDGKRRTVVVPISDIVLTCHLAPLFYRLDPGYQLSSRCDLLADSRRFYFNHYYNRYLFALIEHWRRCKHKGLI